MAHRVTSAEPLRDGAVVAAGARARVRVPASTANLGPGFDSIGMALGGVRLSPGAIVTFLAVFVVGYGITRFIQGAFRTSILPRTRIDAGDARQEIVDLRPPLRRQARGRLALGVRGEAEDLFHHAAVVPAAVEQGDLAGRRQVRHVALEVPLRLFPVRGRGQGDHAADARVEPLGDALDHAALAGGVATLEDHHDLLLFVLHPVLQLDQLALHAEQLFEVDLAVERVAVRRVLDLAEQLVEALVVELELQLLVEAVRHLFSDLRAQRVAISVLEAFHWTSP